MAYKIGGSLGNLLIEENHDNNVQFNNNTYHKNLVLNKVNDSYNFNDMNNNKFDWLIGSTQQLNIIPKNSNNYWTIQGHSNFWSHGLSKYYGVGLNTGEGFSVSTATVYNMIGNSKLNFDEWSLQKNAEQINTLRTPRLYFKFGEKNNYPSTKQTDSGKDPWNEPINTIAYMSGYPDNEQQNSGNVIKNTSSDNSSNYVPGSDPAEKIVGEIPVRILNNFTGQHRVISDLVEDEDNYVGFIVSSLGKTTNYHNNKKLRGKNGININEALPEVEL